MKQLFIILSLASLASCKTMKVNKVTGEKKETANTRHFKTVYKEYGAFHTGKGLVALPGQIVITKKSK